MIHLATKVASAKALPPLDYFEHLCKYLHKRIDKGIGVFYISLSKK